MHLNNKPGEIVQVDWAGDTATVIDTDTGEAIPTYVFVSSLPYSEYVGVVEHLGRSKMNTFVAEN